MTSRRYAVSLPVVVAVGVLGLSACSSEQPSGVAPFTPSVSSGPSPTRTSKWTPEQQLAIDGYDRYNELITRIMSKAEQINMAKVHSVAKEPFATTDMKEVDATLSAGFVETGKAVDTILSVTLAGDKATVKT
jgi:hypothetical protein